MNAVPTTTQAKRLGAADSDDKDIRFILLTECLQNDFFLNRECRLYLGDQAALSMLVGRDAESRRGRGTAARLA